MNGRDRQHPLGYAKNGGVFVPGPNTRMPVVTGVMSPETVPPTVCGRCRLEMTLHDHPVDVDLDLLATALRIKPTDIAEQLEWVAVNKHEATLYWADGGLTKTARADANPTPRGPFNPELWKEQDQP